MKKKNQKIYGIVLLAAVLINIFFLSACLPPNYTKEEAKEVREKGKEMLTEYVSRTYNTKLSQSVDNVVGEGIDLDPNTAYTGGVFLSMLVKSGFMVDGQEYIIYMNTETGDVYTDFYKDDINRAASEIIESSLNSSGVSCKMAVTNVEYRFNVTTDNGTKVVAEIKDAYPDNVFSDNAKEYILDTLLTGAECVFMDMYCAGEEGFLTADAWNSTVSEYPGLARIKAFNYPEQYIDELLSTGELPISADMWMKEEYYLNSSVYNLIDYEVINKDDVYVNAAAKKYVISSDEAGTITETICNCEVNISGSHIEITTDNDYLNRIYFKGDKYKKKKAEVCYSFSDDPTKYTFMDCGEGYYTFKTSLEPQVFSFMNKLTVDIK